MVKLTGNIINSSQLHELENFRDKIKKFGVNFAFYSTNGELSLLYESGNLKSNPEQLKKIGHLALE